MKKYLLTSLLGVFTLFGAFVSAELVEGDIEGGIIYSPSSLYFDNGVVYKSVSVGEYSCTDKCIMYLGYDIDNFPLCSIKYENGVLTNTCTNFSVSDSDEFYSMYIACNSNDFMADSCAVGYSPFTSIDLSLSTTPISGEDDGEDDSTSSGTFLPNGTNDLKPIINGLQSTMAEFIPYVAYIGLGIIVAVLGFVAIRRLVNWVRAKIFDNF